MPIIVFVLLLCLSAAPGAAQDRITVLTDAFGATPALARDWGYSALVEIGGRRILFDAGNHAGKFEQNVRALGVDLGRLDFVVISHRHGDHTAGLRFLRGVNPDVKIYAPRDEHFGGPTPAAFFRPEPDLPREMRYFDGTPPADVPHGSAWGDIPFVQVDVETEIAAGVRVVPAVSEAPGMRDLRELALAIDTPSGQVVLAGCSHPGIEQFLKAVSGHGRVRLLAGGFHWVTTPADQIRRMAAALRKDFDILSIAPGHCTGETGFRELRAAFGERYLYAGVGTVIPLNPVR